MELIEDIEEIEEEIEVEIEGDSEVVIQVETDKTIDRGDTMIDTWRYSFLNEKSHKIKRCVK